MKNEMKKIMRALGIMWASAKGKIAILGTGAIVLAVVASLITTAVIRGEAPENEAASDDGTSTPQTAAGEDLFAPPPEDSSGKSPKPQPNGQVDIGGGGIPANHTDTVDPEKPEAVVDPGTGLAAFPARVPHSKLTIPLREDMTVQECASSRIPEARDYADEMVAYLYTWDADTARWGDFITPIHDVWDETVGGRGNRDAKIFGTDTWENSLASMGYGEDEWANWSRLGMASEVRINNVLTTVGAKGAPMTADYGIRLEYTVTITRTVPGKEPQSEEVYPMINVYAPCPGGDVVPALFRDTLVDLQLGEFGQLVGGR